MPSVTKLPLMLVVRLAARRWTLAVRLAMRMAAEHLLTEANLPPMKEPGGRRSAAVRLKTHLTPPIMICPVR